MSDMPQWGTITFEVVKLGAQFGGALVVAKLAVNWALRRYKSEKIWERQLAAFSDSVSALAHLRKVLHAEIDQFEEQGGSHIDRDLYQKSWRTLEEVIATARLLLPLDVATRLHQFDVEFSAADGYFSGDPVDVLYPQVTAVNGLLEYLVERGRTDIGGFPKITPEQ